MSRFTLRHSATYLVVPALLVGIGWYASSWYHHNYDCEQHRRVRLEGFRYISPLLDVELPEGVSVSQEPIPFKFKIKDFVQKQIDAGTVRDLTVYYRDLLDGPWFAINAPVKYDPASMMKVPVMIAWLKRAELYPDVLKRTFVYDGREDLSVMQEIKPRQTITPGRSYTVEELLHYMLNYSDNNATALLYNGLSTKELNEVLDSMDINNDPSDGSNAVTAHGYSGFFRILYNAAYLNREMSEKALQLLSLQEFPQGIVAGVPKGVTVASKFGEHAEGMRGEDKQLHEFGIVYHPKGAYILGIMTRGHDKKIQAEVIRDISALIYAEVDSRKLIKGGR